MIQRQEGGWTERELEGIGAVTLPRPDLTLTLDQIYGLVAPT
ncbi:hypothetical protein [Deinococcus sp.]|nr:hypothetical protein [Deinococcus sp.]